MSKWIISLILTSLGRVPVVYNFFTVSKIEQDLFCEIYFALAMYTLLTKSKFILVLSYFLILFFYRKLYP